MLNIRKNLIQMLALFAIVLLPVAMLAQTNQGYSKKKQTTTKNAKASVGHKSKAESSWRGHSSAPSSVMSHQERDRIIQNLIANMVYVEGGTFNMGATSEQGRDANSDEKPPHQVTLSSFYICKFEVTQALWKVVMGTNPSYYKGNSLLPIENVSWDNCQEFIRKLNAMTGKHFRLPTEAEWEYAARGGKRSKGYIYAGSNNLDEVAWYGDNSGSITHPVGTKAPNELGLYDMSGNVLEWCQDLYDSSYYNFSPQNNPLGPSSGSIRINRGGSFSCSVAGCRKTYRFYSAPWNTHSDLGLRLAL